MNKHDAVENSESANAYLSFSTDQNVHTSTADDYENSTTDSENSKFNVDFSRYSIGSENSSEQNSSTK